MAETIVSATQRVKQVDGSYVTVFPINSVDEVYYDLDNKILLRDVITDMKNKLDYINPEILSFSMTPSTTQYEIGTKLSANSLLFAWSLNKEVTEITLNSVVLDKDSAEYTYPSELSTTTTFTLNINDGTNSAKSSKTISFLPHIYFGASSSIISPTTEFILGMANKKLSSSKKGTFTVTANDGEYAYLCIPTRYGSPVCVIGGFNTDLVTAGTVESFTNASGYTESYTVYRTSQTGLGTVSMVIS